MLLVTKKPESLTSLERTEAVLAKKKADLEKTQKRYDRLKRAELQRAAKERARLDQLVGMTIREADIDLYNRALIKAGEKPKTTKHVSTTSVENVETNDGESVMVTDDAGTPTGQRVGEKMRQNREENAQREQARHI